MEPHNQKHHHHILPTKVALGIGGTLLFLTIVTVWVAGIDLGPLNFTVAMIVATVKALLVALFFMNLYYDRKENAVIFATSFLFLIIFIVLTATDLFFRGDVYVKGPLMAAAPSGGSKLKKPWIATPELVAKGKQLFQQQCVSCHGVEGKGDGPAAAALNPRPRNFHVSEGWKNGRKVSMVFKTLKDGIPGSSMASYATLHIDDRWALVHYVGSLNAEAVPADSAEDFKKVGIDITQESGGATEAATIPYDFALERVVVQEPKAMAQAHEYTFAEGYVQRPSTGSGVGAQVYQVSCAQCHGEKAQGGVKVKKLGGFTHAYVTTLPLSADREGMRSQEAFNQVVIQGLPGHLMPGFGQLSGSELRELYQFIRTQSVK